MNLYSPFCFFLYAPGCNWKLFYWKSSHFWTGKWRSSTTGHCECSGCKDFRKLGSEIRGCVQGPKFRRKKSTCETDDNWTDVCLCETSRCNGVGRVQGWGRWKWWCWMWWWSAFGLLWESGDAWWLWIWVNISPYWLYWFWWTLILSMAIKLDLTFVLLLTLRVYRWWYFVKNWWYLYTVPWVHDNW